MNRLNVIDGRSLMLFWDVLEGLGKIISQGG